MQHRKIAGGGFYWPPCRRDVCHAKLMHPEGTPRLELRCRRGEIIRDNGFEGNLWFALEYDQQIGQESGSNIYISLGSNRKNI